MRQSALGKTAQGEMFGGVWFKLGWEVGHFFAVKFDDEFYWRPLISFSSPVLCF